MSGPNATQTPDRTKSHLAWWSASLGELKTQDDASIIERLNLRLVEAYFTARYDQIPAWQTEIRSLRRACKNLPENWRLLLEYPLLRLDRRLDAVLLTDHAIFVLEFKASKHDNAGRSQVKDYALDLRDFHAGCRHHPIIPILIANTETPPKQIWPLIWSRYDNPVFEANYDSLGELIAEIIIRIDHHGVDIQNWEVAPYRPVPTIIEAATMLFRKHGVEDIKTARADMSNLTLTTDVILKAISDAKKSSHFIIVFVTGIPGAGKTLCGLNAVFSSNVEAAFLTGTLPMIHVLKAALAADAIANGKSKTDATRETKSKIQSITGFLKYYRDQLGEPAEHVIVFDEAQRAWDAKYGAASKFKWTNSEAAIVLDIMHRHKDYAVIIALVGNGQEINNGEAGLAEWGIALQDRPEWQIRAAPSVIETTQDRQRLFAMPPLGLVIDSKLHLSVPIRSIRSPQSAPWVDAVLRGQPTEAKQYAADGVPFFITRSLAAMRVSLRNRVGGQRRSGLVCSSGAKRLIADGLWPKFDHLDDSTVANWFLKSWPDVRASDALEIPATEFACQGLELDYVGLCWGGDFLWPGRWVVRNFSGSKWQYPKKPDAIEFCRNTYRVLLTRARYDTIIWIPPGEISDKTREPELFNQTAEYLLECGAMMLEDVAPLHDTSEVLLF